MSSFRCEHCGASIIHTPIGYVTSCEHHRAAEMKNGGPGGCLLPIDALKTQIENLERNLLYVHEQGTSIERDLAKLRAELERRYVE